MAKTKPFKRGGCLRGEEVDVDVDDESS